MSRQQLIYCLLLPCFINYFSVFGFGETPTITVSGDAVVRVVPDIVVVGIGIESRGKTVSSTAAATDQKVGDVLKFLRESGVRDADIQTDSVSIKLLMQSAASSNSKGKQQQIQMRVEVDEDPFGEGPLRTMSDPFGYSVSRELTITLNDLKKFEPIYKGLIEKGVNRFSRLDFRTSKSEPLQASVRLDAVRAAKEKANAMAKELGATLESVQTIRERSSGYPSRRDYGMSADPFGDSSTDSTTFSAGQVSIFCSVEVVFVLGDVSMSK